MLSGAKVLLVGEHCPSGDETAAALRAAGATVLEAGSAQVALLTLQAESPDLLLSELILPDADGYALIHAVRRLPDPRLAGVPAVALTDHATDEERQHSLVAGFQLHMVRPTDARGLALTLSGLRRLSAAAAEPNAG